MENNCIHCGGGYGLHHSQTMQCPVGGREAPLGTKQEWMTYTFEAKNESVEELFTRVEKLEAQIADLQRAEVARLDEKFQPARKDKNHE